MCGYVADYLPYYAKVAQPLRAACKSKARRLPWGSPQEAAFVELKRLLLVAPVLAHPQLGADAGEFVMRVDGSKLGLGACLYQRQGGRLRPIMFASASPSRRRSTMTRRDASASRWSSASRSSAPWCWGERS